MILSETGGCAENMYPIYPTEFRVELLSCTFPVLGFLGASLMPNNLESATPTNPISAVSLPSQTVQKFFPLSLQKKSSKLLLPTVAIGVFGLSEYQLLLLAFVARLEQIDASKDAYTHHQAMHGDRLRRFFGGPMTGYLER